MEVELYWAIGKAVAQIYIKSIYTHKDAHIHEISGIFHGTRLNLENLSLLIYSKWLQHYDDMVKWLFSFFCKATVQVYTNNRNMSNCGHTHDFGYIFFHISHHCVHMDPLLFWWLGGISRGSYDRIPYPDCILIDSALQELVWNLPPFQFWILYHDTNT